MTAQDNSGKTGEIILVNKPLRWTSFDVVKKVRGSLSRRVEGVQSKIKVGHAGTLDPLATGLLILCTGAMTKKIAEIQAAEKEYTGSMLFGSTRPSYDLETEIDEYFPTSHLTEEKIKAAALHFTGEQLQTPPAHSAVKVDGVRAYKKARKGQEFEITPKRVFIKEFEILSVQLPEIQFRVVCSKGTYIRSLAHDMGIFLGSGAHLTGLCRQRIGEYRLKDACNMDYFKKTSEIE